MIGEEAARIIDEKLVEIGRDRLAHTEAQGHIGDELGQGFVPMTSVDSDLTSIDLPGSPDIAIDHRVLAASIGGRLGDCNEPPALGG